MQIILLEKVVNLGNLGDVVKVKDGYARNFLIPSRQAKRATANAIKAVGEKLAGSKVKLTQKAGVDGRLFGSVTNHDIADELVKMGFVVTKSQVRMPTGPIKIVGETTVSVALHTDVVVEITISVLGETA
jgi:large subunit ribosomal protein L9